MGKFLGGKSRERRKYPRIKDSIFIIFQSSKDDISSDAVIEDISRGGLKFISTIFIPERTELKLEICQPLTFDKDLFLSMSAKVRTVWIKKTNSNNEYLIGAEIIKMDKRDQYRLAGYIDSRLEAE